MKGGFSLLCKLLQGGNRNAQLLHEPAVAAIVTDTFHCGGYTPAWQGFEILGLGEWLFSDFSKDCLGERMLGLFFQGSGNGQQLLPGDAAGKNVCHRRFSGGKGSGFIQNHRVYMMEIFQSFRILEQNAHSGTPARAHHNGNRSCQSQGAGTGNNKNRNSGGQGEFQCLSSDHPCGKSDCGDGHDYRHKYSGDLVRQPGDGSLGAAGFFHHADHLGKSGVFAHLICPEFQVSFRVDGGGGHRISGNLLHRDAFAGESALINGSPAFQHRSVHRDAAAGADDDDIACNHFFYRDFLNLSIPANCGAFGT